MCEFCQRSEVTLEKLDSDEIHPCEWISEESGPGACTEQAEYSVSDWFVEDHLCDAHKIETKKRMEQGLRDLLDSGVQLRI